MFFGSNLLLQKRDRSRKRGFDNLGAVLNRGCHVVEVGAEVSWIGWSLQEIPRVASESYGGCKESACNRLFLQVV